MASQIGAYFREKRFLFWYEYDKQGENVRANCALNPVGRHARFITRHGQRCKGWIGRTQVFCSSDATASDQSWTKWPCHCWNKSLKKPFRSRMIRPFMLERLLQTGECSTMLRLETLHQVTTLCVRTKPLASLCLAWAKLCESQTSPTLKLRSSWKTPSGGKDSHVN